MSKRFTLTLVSVLAIASAMGGSAQAQTAPDPAAAVAVAPPNPDAVRYGFAVRFPRWVSVPSWFLDLFTKQNEPLSTFAAFGGEFIRRKGDLDIVIGVHYQSMGPRDGNWVGKGKDPRIDTDFVQFRDFALLGVDAAFIWRQNFNEYFGLHYGAGLGLAKVLGKMLRISAAGCTEANAGDTSMCRPKPCPPEGCTESILKGTEGSVDNGPDDPHRFKDQNVPGAIPILNVLAGVTVRIPELRGFEARFEGGFYNAFFLGMGLGYVF